MVLSTTKLTSSVDSITNANQGGGNKKAGLPASRNKDYHFPIAKKVHPTRDTLANYGNPIVYGLRWTPPGKEHKAQRPLWSTYRPNTYFVMPLSA